MRKLSALLLAGVLTAVASVSTFAAGAAGINSAEQAVLDELHTSVMMNGTEMIISDEFVNQAQNYFNTIEMTDAESQEIIGIIEKGKTFLANSGAYNIADLSYEQKQELLAYGEEVVGVIDMTMSYDKTNKTLTISDPEGEVAFKAVPTLQKVATPSTEPTSATSATSTTSATSATSATSKSSTTTQGKVTSSDVIKTTGANVNTAAFAGVAGVAVLMAAAGATYAVKTKKERA
ncbi:MAG: hypothetical protein U0M12_06685 [Acutalibacteraceae bacterium]|nr:hypothetical protein [Acutalibacteraceae bacterium]